MFSHMPTSPWTIAKEVVILALSVCLTFQFCNKYINTLFFIFKIRTSNFWAEAECS